MKLLVDTHVFLWLISDDPRLPRAFREAICDPRNAVYLSVASIWEVVIKHGIGKLPLPSPPAQYLIDQLNAHQITSLSIDEDSIPYLASLPPLHRDPFDRLMVAQALQHGLTLITMDDAIKDYPLAILNIT